MAHKIVVFTDGASFNNGNKNPDLPQHATGGLVMTLNETVIYQKAFDYGDNSISYAELNSFYNALKDIRKKLPKLPKNIEITIVCDSAYVVRSFNEYSIKWEKNGFRNSSGDDVSYKDTWKEILRLKKEIPNLVVIHTKGHQKDDSFFSRMNNEVDKVATTIMQKWKNENGYK